MLAQAQECFWKKAVLSKMKNGTIMKLAKAASSLYCEAYKVGSNNNIIPQVIFCYYFYIFILLLLLFFSSIFYIY